MSVEIVLILDDGKFRIPIKIDNSESIIKKITKEYPLTNYSLFYKELLIEENDTPIIIGLPPSGSEIKAVTRIRMQETLKVVKLHEDAILPTRKSEGAAGYDLATREALIINPTVRKLVELGFCIAIPPGYYGRIAPRSGLSLDGLDIAGGVIDSDYRGDVRVILVNNSTLVKHFGKGDRIAQLIIEKIYTPPVEEVKQLDETRRATGGFGSTGI